MANLTYKKLVVSTLIYFFLLAEVAPGLAFNDNLQVAFVGLKFKNLPREAQDIIAWRMAAILDSQEKFILTKSDAAGMVYGHEKLAELVEKQDAASFQSFAKQFGFSHVFSGKLSNNSEDADNLYLVGELSRFDSETGEIKHYPIQIEYAKFGNELVEFRNQYVESLTMKNNRGRGPWRVLLASGIVLGAILTIRLGFGGPGGDEQRDPDTGSDN